MMTWKNRIALTAVAAALQLCVGAGVVAAQTDGTPASTRLPARGDASAPVVILLFSDFECPYCARVEPVLEQVRKEFAKEVQVVFKHTPLSMHARAPLAHEAAVEAARQGRFWEMHDLLFGDQKRLEKSDLIAHAEKLGLNVKAFTAALDDRRHKADVDRDLVEGRALGVTGTPTLFVNGQRLVGVPPAAQLITHIRSVLSGKSTSKTEDVLDPGALDLRGSPSRGPSNAPVTIVEFSDLQCPFCGRATAVVENVMKAYNGKVRWVFKHFPLDFHPDAELAHRASLAAGEQGKFWEMHDAIFQNQRAMKREDLIRHATTLALDVPRFLAGLDDPRFTAAVQKDLAEGKRVGVDGTPTFFVNGRRLVGAKPLEAFRAIIDSEIGKLSSPLFVRPASGDAVGPDVLDMAMSRGPVDAPVTIRWFADFGNALHKDAVALLRRALAAHPKDVRLVFMHRPLQGREGSWSAHEATIAAAEQGKFWEVHDLLVARPSQNQETLAANVARLGVDRSWFEEGLSTGRARKALDRHVEEAKALDVRGTPTFLVNGSRLDGVVSDDTLEAVIEKELSAAKLAR